MFYSQLAMCLTRRISFHIYQWVMFCCVKKKEYSNHQNEKERMREIEKKKSQTKPNRNNIEQHSIITTCVFNII